MKIALAVPRLVNDIRININKIDGMITQACINKSSLILFPEAVLTGLINNDIYEHDIALAVSLKSKIILDFCEKAKNNGIWLCFGFLENDDECIYDSAVLINPKGEITIHHRRINPQWRAKNLPHNHYSEGEKLNFAVTPFGKTVILICGDLFDDNVMAMLDKIQPDFVLFPFARCFSSKVKNIQKEWDEKEQQEYVNRIRCANADFALANYIGSPDINDTSFGGAFVINKNGEISASLSLMREGILYCEKIL